MYALVLLLLLGSPIFQGELFVVADETFVVGQEVVANVVLRNIDALSAFEFRVELDQNALKIIEVTSGRDWENSYLFHAGETSEEGVYFSSGAAVSNEEPIGIQISSEDFIVVTIRFIAKTIGVTSITLNDIFLTDASGNEIVPVITNKTIEIVEDEMLLIKPVPK